MHVELLDNAKDMDRWLTITNLLSLGCFAHTMQLCIQPKLSSSTDGDAPKKADMLFFIKHNLALISFKHSVHEIIISMLCLINEHW